MYLAFPVSSGRFTQASHVPGYSGTIEERFIVFVYGTFTLYGCAFQHIPLTITLYNSLLSLSTKLHRPTTPHLPKGRCSLGYSLFARRYSENIVAQSNLFSFPLGTEMFHFPKFTPRHLHGNMVLLIRVGFPIRKSSAHWLHIASPKLIADLPRPSSSFTSKASSKRP